MAFHAAVLTLALLLVTAACNNVYAVGYERYEVSGAQATVSGTKSESGESLCQSVKKAMFLEKIPGVLDHVAVFIRDIFDQFGLQMDRHD